MSINPFTCLVASAILLSQASLAPSISRAEEPKTPPPACTATCSLYASDAKTVVSTSTVEGASLYDLKVKCWESTGDDVGVPWAVSEVSCQ